MSGHDRDLPPEIWTQILTKIPVKSILRCRSVCKAWYSLVSSPTFISYHTTQTLNEERVLVHRLGNTVYSESKYSFHDKSFVESHEHHHVPQLLRSPEIEIVGSCHGLICFCRCDITRDGTVHNFLIWNPTIRKSVEPPFCYSPPCPFQIRSYLFGFGFDYESRDYKVVRVVYPETYRSNVEVVAECDIFDLRKGVWRSSSSPMRTFFLRQTCVYLCGNLHWIREDGTPDNFVLLSMNLSGEVLQELGVVPGVAETNEDGAYFGSYAKLFPINGLLSAAVVKKKHPAGGVRQHFISVWSMKEYGVIGSWSKLFHIGLPCSLGWWPRLLRCWENGEVLILQRHMRENLVRIDFERTPESIVLYNPESKECRLLLSTSAAPISNVCYYTETLALL